jgi:hypothetical protein
MNPKSEPLKSQTQIKLKNLVLDSYIPADEMQKLTQHATYDEREEIWRMHRAQV